MRKPLLWLLCASDFGFVSDFDICISDFSSGLEHVIIPSDAEAQKTSGPS